jgi:hypothetical protein
MDSGLIKILVVVVVLAAVGFGAYVFWPSGDGGQRQTQPKEEPKSFRDVAREDDVRLNATPMDASGKPMQFEKLEIEQEVNAEELLTMAIKFREMGRLPGVNYGQMVDTCRLIIERYPRSEYAYKAKRILADIPREYWDDYGITMDEVRWQP